MMLRRILLSFLCVAVFAGILVVWLRRAPHPENQKPGNFPETLVFARSKDDVVSGGVMFTPPKELSKPIAVIWIPGWGTNFYSPSYVGIGRALAARGFTTLSVNTRMHDLANVIGYRRGKRVRGGGYWGVTSEDARDIAAWIDFAQQLGFSRVVLVGHSAGWSSVGRYEADTQDNRVIGLVLASGAVGLVSTGDNPELRSQAKRLVSDGTGDDLIRLPNRSYPSYVSAATYLDIVNAPREYLDFFGTQTANPAVMRVRCPILAFFGTNDDVGGEEHLKLLTSAVRRLRTGPSRVDTAMIRNGNHEYVGQEDQVAQTIAHWVDTVVLPHLENKNATEPRER